MPGPETDLAKLVAGVAKHPALNNEIVGSAIRESGANWPEKRTSKELPLLATNLRSSGQLGRLRASLLLGISMFGDAFLTRFERGGLLLADDQTAQKFGEVLTQLRTEVQTESDSTWRKLSERLNTYEAYRQLVVASSLGGQQAARLIRSWPRHIVRRLMMIAELAFARRHFGVEAAAELNDYLDEEMEGPEETATVVSFLIAQANDYRLLDGGDLGFPLMGDPTDADLWSLMRYGRAQSHRYDIARMISLFNYRLEVTTTDGGSLFYLRPWFDDFEYFLRLGYIRSQLSGSSNLLHISDRGDVPEALLTGAAESFASRYHTLICQVRYPQRPFRYVRVNVPINQEFLRSVIETEFYDDAADEEMLGNEFLLPVRLTGEPEIMLTEHIDLKSFLLIWRIVRFYGSVLNLR